MEKKKIKLQYFTGTGNSRRVLEIIKNIFEQKSYIVRFGSITEKMQYENEKYEYLGFSFPVHSWGAPRIMRQFLKAMPAVSNNQKVLIVATMGGKDEEGWALLDAKRILTKKGYHVTNSYAINMPNNWVVLSNPLSIDETQVLLDMGERQAEDLADKVLSGIETDKEFLWPRSGLLSLLSYYLYRFCGIYILWRFFKVSKRCTSCGLCMKICPTKSIMMDKGKPKWASTCEQCMRCVNFCPQKAIEQFEFIGKGSKKTSYYEPHFNLK